MIPSEAHFAPSPTDILSALKEMFDRMDEQEQAFQLMKDLEIVLEVAGDPPKDPEERLKQIADEIEKRKDLDVSIVAGRVIQSVKDDPELERIAEEILFKGAGSRLSES